MKKWPTPTGRDHKDSGPNVNYSKQAEKFRLAGVVGGSLNPTWVEWLMGFPTEWTVLGASGTASSPKSQRASDSESKNG